MSDNVPNSANRTPRVANLPQGEPVPPEPDGDPPEVPGANRRERVVVETVNEGSEESRSEPTQESYADPIGDGNDLSYEEEEIEDDYDHEGGQPTSAGAFGGDLEEADDDPRYASLELTPVLPHRRSDISHFVRSGEGPEMGRRGPTSQVIAPLQRSQVAFVKATPRNRSHNDFIRAGLRQSIGVGRRSTLFPQEVEVDDDEDEPTEREVYCTERGPIIDGVELRLASSATDAKLWTPRRLWDRTKRSTLPGDVRQAFYRHATGYVLSKTNKLSAPKVTSDNDQFLVQVQNLQ